MNSYIWTYHFREWAVIPVPLRSKAPLTPEWPGLRYELTELLELFDDDHGKQNIGVRTGAPSCGLIDVDLDCPEAVRLAPQFLPPTNAIFGRAGNLHSHRLYVAPWLKATKQFKAPDGTMLLELRASGCQTILPPSVHPSGESVEWEQDGDPAPVDEELTRSATRLAAAALLAKEWPAKGSRDNAAMALAGALLRGGWSVTDADEFIVAVADTAGDGEAASRAKARSTRAKLDSGDDVTGWPRLAELIGAVIVKKVKAWLGMREGGYKLTDLGNAERYVEQHGDDVRYCASWRTWLVWDGKRWKKDDTRAAQRLAQETVRTIYDEASAEKDSERRRSLGKHAFHSEASGKIGALLEQAEPMVPARPVDFDADPWLLNCENGVLDLRTAELRPHRREDWLTKLAPVRFEPDAHSDLWDDFLRVCTYGDSAKNVTYSAEVSEDLVGYLQRCAGYTLTGRATEFDVFFIHGPSWSGKSKFLGALRDVLGPDYAVQTSFDTFLAKRYGGGKSNDIADLKGARMVLAIEANEGEKFNEAMLKQMTGGDDVRARQLYQTNEQWKPQMKIWFASNHLPRVSDVDGAIWNRMKRVPFVHVMPEKERDLTLADKFAMPANRSAILAWAVRGCLAWQREGLNPPPIVVAATQTYKEEMNVLAAWIEERCVVEANATTPFSELYESFKRWSVDSAGYKRTNSAKWLAAKLDGHGYPKVDGPNRSIKMRRGLKLADDPKQETGY